MQTGEALGVGEAIKIKLRVALRGPLLGQRGKDDDYAFILVISQEAALADSAEALRIFSFKKDKSRISGEDSVAR